MKSSVDKDREKKLRKLDKIVAAIKRDKARGKKLFHYRDPDNHVYEYYKSERSAKSAAKIEVPKFDAVDGSLTHFETDYKDYENIDLDFVIGTLELHQNPFPCCVCHGDSYPYKWLQDAEDLFLTDPNDRKSGWDERLFPEDK